jgi:hypothetical protein
LVVGILTPKTLEEDIMEWENLLGLIEIEIYSGLDDIIPVQEIVIIFSTLSKLLEVTRTVGQG